MNCDDCLTMLEDNLWDDLSSAERQSVRDHAGSCPSCAEHLRRNLALDAALTMQLPIDPAVRRKPVGTLRRVVRPLGWAAVLALALLAGRDSVVREFGPTVAAADQTDSLDAVNMGFESAAQGWSTPTENWEGPPEPWTVAHESKSFQEIDARVSHSGRRSLKLYLREWGGSARRTFSTPVPAGTLVRMVCWLKTPAAGSKQNKYLSIGIHGVFGPEKRVQAVAATDVFDASPFWRPVVLWGVVALDSSALNLLFTTGSGNGSHKGFDKAVWIDDVAIELVLPVSVQTWRQQGSRVTVRFSPPKGYTLGQVEASSLRLVGTNLHAPWVPGRLLPTGEAEFDLGPEDDKPLPRPVSLRFRLSVADGATGERLSLAASEELPFGKP